MAARQSSFRPLTAFFRQYPCRLFPYALHPFWGVRRRKEVENGIGDGQGSGMNGGEVDWHETSRDHVGR